MQPRTRPSNQYCHEEARSGTDWRLAARIHLGQQHNVVYQRLPLDYTICYNCTEWRCYAMCIITELSSPFVWFDFSSCAFDTFSDHLYAKSVWKKCKFFMWVFFSFEIFYIAKIFGIFRVKQKKSILVFLYNSFFARFIYNFIITIAITFMVILQWMCDLIKY